MNWNMMKEEGTLQRRCTDRIMLLACLLVGGKSLYVRGWRQGA